MTLRTSGRRRIALAAALLAAAVGIAGCTAPRAATGSSAQETSTQETSAQATGIAKVVRAAVTSSHLQAVIVRVTVDGRPVITAAFGESMTGVPATTDMRFRNGAVAFSYLATLLLEYVDEHKVKLDDTVDKWMPELPEADQVTLKMLADQTSGYPDYETDPGWNAAYNQDPFHLFTFEERLDYAFSRPPMFAPGTNWSYAHTNFMILGHILSLIGKKPLDVLLRQKVLEPMGLSHTVASSTGDIPDPVLHAFSSERRPALGIPASTPFYEESTYWNPSWGTPIGAAETTDITDLTTTAIAVGTGELLSRSSFHAMTDPNLLGFGQSMPNCRPSCFTQVDGYNYGLGVVRSGSWLLQNPLLSGYSATEAYLASRKVAIAVASTFAPGAFDGNGVYPNASDKLFRQIGAYLVPEDAPPIK